MMTIRGLGQEVVVQVTKTEAQIPETIPMLSLVYLLECVPSMRVSAPRCADIICTMVTKPGHVKDGVYFLLFHPMSYLILALLHVPHPLTPYPISWETRRAIRKSHNRRVAT